MIRKFQHEIWREEAAFDVVVRADISIDRDTCQRGSLSEVSCDVDILSVRTMDGADFPVTAEEEAIIYDICLTLA